MQFYRSPIPICHILWLKRKEIPHRFYSFTDLGQIYAANAPYCECSVPMKCMFLVTRAQSESNTNQQITELGDVNTCRIDQ